jgi:hypothetical protein
MSVQRLKAWLSHIARAWSARSVARKPTVPAQRTLSTVGQTAPLRSGLASGRWLDDSRRLRARPAPRPRPALSPASREQLRRILRDPTWAVTYDATLAPRPPRTPPPSDPRAPQPSGESASSRPLATPSPAAASEDQADREQRRLRFVRDLVRRGVYNEGFDSTHLPDQYRPKASDADA